MKLEGGVSRVAQIEAITHAGIPFMAHIGMLPQSVREQGGYRIKGRTQSEVEALLADARAVEDAGAFSVVLEIVVADVAKQITDAIDIPTIGIGSGEHCDGQILVTHDLIGLFPWFTPEICVARSACGGGNTPRCACIYRADQEQQRNVIGVRSAISDWRPMFLRQLESHVRMIRESKCDMFAAA